jgi:hypothetical protein
MGFKHRGPDSAAPARATNSGRPAANVLVPRLPLPAIFSFAVAGFGGAVFLSYSFFPGGAATTSSARSVNEVPVYSARAVPRDAENTAGVPAPITLTAKKPEVMAQTESQPVETTETSSSSRSLIASSTKTGFEGFDGFANSRSPNSFLALSGIPMGVGISAESSSGHSAPDAVSLSSVPEPSTWLAGAVLGALVGGRWLRSRWRRSKR